MEALGAFPHGTPVRALFVVSMSSYTPTKVHWPQPLHYSHEYPQVWLPNSVLWLRLHGNSCLKSFCAHYMYDTATVETMHQP